MTAYEMRISDWSSDVCPSDLVDAIAIQAWRNPFHPLHDQPALRGMQRTAGRTGALVHIEARHRMADAARAEYARPQLRDSRQRSACLATVFAAIRPGIHQGIAGAAIHTRQNAVSIGIRSLPPQRRPSTVP